MSRKRTEKIQYDLNGLALPIHIHYEKRNNVRAAIGTKAVNVRLPLLMPAADKKEAWKNIEKWLSQKENQLKARFGFKNYQSGDTLQVGDKSYVLHIEYTTHKSHTISLKNSIITLKIAQGDSNEQKAIKTLLSRIVAQDFQEKIERRVRELNHLHFKVVVNEVKLKYTNTRWGSCSSKGNLNFSTRLLFAPDDVIDYLIIHELAHRIEMNHSPKFWKLVSNAMPNYREKEKWLDEYGKDCDF